MPEIRLQMRRDTAANWTANNPVLSEGEIGLETDTGWHKIGDGATAWTALGYYHGPPWLQGIDGGTPSSTYPGAPTNPYYGVMATVPPDPQITSTTIIDSSVVFGTTPADIATDGAGNWVVVCTNGTLFEAWYSTDGGLNWTEATTTFNLTNGAPNSVTYGEGAFVAMSSGVNVVLRSTDGGDNWTEVRDTAQNYNGVNHVFYSPSAGKFITNGLNQNIQSADGNDPWSSQPNGTTAFPEGYIFTPTTTYIYGSSGASSPRNGSSTNASTWSMSNDFPATGDNDGQVGGQADYDGTTFAVTASLANDYRYWTSGSFAAPWSADTDNRYHATKTDGIKILNYIPYLEKWYIVTEIGEVFTSTDPTAGSSGWTQVTGGNLPGNIPYDHLSQDDADDAWIFINSDRDLVVNTFG